ncbi:precorrin-3B synthase [Kribbella qitaiheensis]|uniref:precorrin-3B synthase n=1 Tax=Kribbella qitaiheensis TaxID=1544730 RepID=UPI0036108A1D
MPPVERLSTDRCPGVLAVHQAADGGLARVRLPGGLLSIGQLEVLAAASAELGDGNLELTSRANLQIRALRPGAPRALSDQLYAVGLLPSITHERIRNILASPLSGLDQHSLYDVLPAAAELDRLLCDRPGLAELPGRFLFALDDGRGDLASARADVAVRVVPGGQALLALGGVVCAQTTLAEMPAVMVAAAEAFLVERAEQRSEAWRLAELQDGPARVLKRLDVQESTGELRSPAPLVAGHYQQPDGQWAVVATVPLGSLRQEQASALAFVAAQGVGQIRVTPWRSVVVAGLADVEDAVGRLQAVGLVVESESPWNGVTACAGRPGCAKALADVRAEAWRMTPTMAPGHPAVHWSGCERRCGRPTGDHVEVLALAGGGYSIDGIPADDLASSLSPVRTAVRKARS